MSTAENKVKTRVKKILAGLDKLCYTMPAASIYGKAGRGDFVLCVAGQYVEIETKAGGNEQSELQKKWEREVWASGGVYLLINESNVEELPSILSNICKRGIK